jgi:beta-glucosidase
MKKTLIMLSAAILGAACAPKGPQAIPADSEVEAKVEKVLKGMTLEEKAGQLVQLNISVLEDDTREAIDPAKLDRIIGQYKVGSILNVMNDHCHSREVTAAMVRQIQEKSMEKIGIPCIYGLDMIHGASYLSDGSLYPQEINLVATFNRSIRA